MLGYRCCGQLVKPHKILCMGEKRERIFSGHFWTHTVFFGKNPAEELFVLSLYPNPTIAHCCKVNIYSVVGIVKGVFFMKYGKW